MIVSHPVVTREQLVELLNEDLSREFQALMACVKDTRPSDELADALFLSRQIDYLGGTPTITKFDTNDGDDIVANYRSRIRQCEQLGEFGMARQIRQRLVHEREDHSSLPIETVKEKAKWIQQHL